MRTILMQLADGDPFVVTVVICMALLAIAEAVTIGWLIRDWEGYRETCRASRMKNCRKEKDDTQ